MGFSSKKEAEFCKTRLFCSGHQRLKVEIVSGFCVQECAAKAIGAVLAKWPANYGARVDAFFDIIGFDIENILNASGYGRAIAK